MEASPSSLQRPQPEDAGGLGEVCGDPAVRRATGQSRVSCTHTAAADAEGITNVGCMDSTPKYEFSLE